MDIRRHRRRRHQNDNIVMRYQYNVDENKFKLMQPNCMQVGG